ncbi:tetraspanin-7-like [Amaranthus tricolor]|uniref:tetraspanin-7-like n=1 Tax=Amaranthus tricolor TaxID=29722 RepID=UPI00258D453D|nr:tetraspanin-7-like [Amaranthus tricolor]
MVDISAKDIAKLNSDQICVLFLFLMEYATTGSAIVYGLNLLCTTSSASAGFRFYGIILIIIGVVLMILCYVSCSLARETELAILKSMCCSVPLFIALAALGIFALSVSSKGGGQTIPGRSYKEYHVESYSKWMQNKVNNLHHWENYYKKSLLKSNVCDNFYHKYELDTIDEFHKRSLDAFESGCCKPSEDCNFNYTSPSIWVKPIDGNYTNIDCNRWSNDENTLCFDCQSCKAAFLQDVTTQWFTPGVIFVVLAAKHLLIGLCVIGLSDVQFGPSSQGYRLTV